MKHYFAVVLCAAVVSASSHTSSSGPMTVDTDITVEVPQTLFPDQTWGERRELTAFNDTDANLQWCSPTDPPVDCNALVKLFDAIDNHNSYYTSWDGYNMVDTPTDHTLIGKWKKGTSFCTWERVTCAGYGDPTNFLPSRRRVYRIDLSRMNLNGTIPAEIGDLTELVHLDLSWNRFTGSIPSSIGNLVKLQQLSLHHNKLDGTIPSSIGNLAKVNTVELGHNFLTGPVPATVAGMDHLERLSLRRNQLTGQLPGSTVSSGTATGKGLCNLDNLEYLVAWDNKLTGTIPDCLCPKNSGQAQTLLQVKLQKNQLDGAIPASLGNCVNLNWLDFSDNLLDGTIPQNITACDKLRHINTFHNQLRGVSMHVNKFNMPNLRDFIVDHDLQPHYPFP